MIFKSFDSNKLNSQSYFSGDDGGQLEFTFLFFFNQKKKKEKSLPKPAYKIDRFKHTLDLFQKPFFCITDYSIIY